MQPSSQMDTVQQPFQEQLLRLLLLERLKATWVGHWLVKGELTKAPEDIALCVLECLALLSCH
jgi:hypothetical protein